MTKFTSGQLVRLWIIYVVTAPLAFLLGPLFDVGEFQGWLAVLICCGLSLLWVYAAVKVTNMNPDREWGEWGRRVMGTWLHSLFMVLIIMFCLSLVSFNVGSYTDLFGSIYLQGTPDWVIAGAFLFCVSIISRSGLKIIVYMTDGFFILVLGSVLLIIPFFSGQLNYNMSIALLTHWDMSILTRAVLFAFTWFGEMALVFLLLSNFKTQGKAMRYLTLANVVGCLLIVIYWLATLLLFGPHLGSHLRFPLMETIRFVKVSQLVENLDPLLLSIWSSSLLVKSCLLLYVSAKLTSQLFRTESHRPYTFLLGTFILISAIRYNRSPAEFGQFMYSVSFTLGLFLVESIPFLYWIVGRIRKVKLT